MGKVGRPKSEETEVMTFRIPSRLRRLVKKASNSFRSSNEYLNSIIEEDLESKGLLDHNDRRFPINKQNKERK